MKAAPAPVRGRSVNSGAEGYRFEPYRAYHLFNDLAGPPLSALLRGQIGDRFLCRGKRRGLPWSGIGQPHNVERYGIEAAFRA